MNKEEKLKWDDIEEFHQVRSKRNRSNNAFITINREKLIRLSAGFLDQAKDQIENKAYVVLSFSRLNNAIIFNFGSNPKIPGSLRLSMRNKNSTFTTDCTKATGGIISAKTFIIHYEINVDKHTGKQYPAKLENIANKGKFWVVYLDKKGRKK